MRLLSPFVLSIGVLAVSGCGGSHRATGLYDSAATKSCLEAKGIAVDTTGKKWSPVLSAETVSAFGVLEFALSTRHYGRTDKAAVYFLADVPRATATLKKLQHASATFADLQPVGDRAKFRRLLKRAQEQHRNAVIMWANFGGSNAGRRLVVGCLR